MAKTNDTRFADLKSRLAALRKRRDALCYELVISETDEQLVYDGEYEVVFIHRDDDDDDMQSGARDGLSQEQRRPQWVSATLA